MGQDVGGDIDFNTVTVGKQNALFHVFHAEVFGFCPQAVGFPADVDGVGAEDYRGF